MQSRSVSPPRAAVPAATPIAQVAHQLAASGVPLSSIIAVIEKGYAERTADLEAQLQESTLGTLRVDALQETNNRQQAEITRLKAELVMLKGQSERVMRDPGFDLNSQKAAAALAKEHNAFDLVMMSREQQWTEFDETPPAAAKAGPSPPVQRLAESAASPLLPEAPTEIFTGDSSATFVKQQTLTQTPSLQSSQKEKSSTTARSSLPLGYVALPGAILGAMRMQLDAFQKEVNSLREQNKRLVAEEKFSKTLREQLQRESVALNLGMMRHHEEVKQLKDRLEVTRERSQKEFTKLDSERQALARDLSEARSSLQTLRMHNAEDVEALNNHIAVIEEERVQERAKYVREQDTLIEELRRTREDFARKSRREAAGLDTSSVPDPFGEGTPGARLDDKAQLAVANGSADFSRLLAPIRATNNSIYEQLAPLQGALEEAIQRAEDAEKELWELRRIGSKNAVATFAAPKRLSNERPAESMMKAIEAAPTPPQISNSGDQDQKSRGALVAYSGSTLTPLRVNHQHPQALSPIDAPTSLNLATTDSAAHRWASSVSTTATAMKHHQSNNRRRTHHLGDIGGNNTLHATTTPEPSLSLPPLVGVKKQREPTVKERTNVKDEKDDHVVSIAASSKKGNRRQQSQIVPKKAQRQRRTAFETLTPSPVHMGDAFTVQKALPSSQ